MDNLNIDLYSQIQNLYSDKTMLWHWHNLEQMRNSLLQVTENIKRFKKDKCSNGIAINNYC